MKIAGRRVKLFRTQIDPMIGKLARNAFMVKDVLGADTIAEVTENETGIYVKLPDGAEHVVPMANVQSIRLEPLADVEAIDIKSKRKQPTSAS